MSIITRVVQLGPNGDGTVTVGPSRLAAWRVGDGEGAVSVRNHGRHLGSGTAQYYFDGADTAPGSEPFVEGAIVFDGDPDGIVNAYINFS